MPSQVTMICSFVIINHINLIYQSESYFSSNILKEADQALSDVPEQTPDYLALLTHPNIPPHQLDLKVNGIFAIQCNLSVKKVVHNHYILHM